MRPRNSVLVDTSPPTNMPWLLPWRLSLVLTSVVIATDWPTVKISAIYSALVNNASSEDWSAAMSA